MLYVTTRNKADAYTAAHAWAKDDKVGEGFYTPFRIPQIAPDEIQKLGQASFGENVAKILNMFHPSTIRPWDVEFTIGRNPVRMVGMSHRIVLSELWHNPAFSYAATVQNLANLLTGNQASTVTIWGQIAIRIATMFGIFGQLQKMQVIDMAQPVDIVVPTGDFTAPMAAWYARRMGLPIGIIICACNENSASWELLHQGNLHTDVACIHTNTPHCDHAVPAAIEMLIKESLGADEARRFSEVVAAGGIYKLSPENHAMLRAGMYSAVISDDRVVSNISSMNRNSGYVASPYTALAYSGLMDYRARTGESRIAVIFAEHNPATDADLVADSLGISKDSLQDLLISG